MSGGKVFQSVGAATEKDLVLYVFKLKWGIKRRFLDLVSNWEFFRDSWQNYATATKLADKDKKIFAATFLSLMGKRNVCTYAEIFP